MKTMTIPEIRDARPSDSAELSLLLAQLGYPEAPSTVTARLAALIACGGRVLVAHSGDRIIGLAALDRTWHLHRPVDGRLTGLVVAEDARGLGIGKSLLVAAEAVFREWGCARSELSSGAGREAAHRFYEREGYVETPKRFVKILGPVSHPES
jgi:GNAT superfamily N-acetyltransferase